MNLDLSQSTATVATVTTPDDLYWLREHAELPCDVIEFRLDNLYAHAEQAGALMQAPPVPALLTVRRAEEGGIHGLDAGSRRATYENFSFGASFIDTEVSSLREPEFSDFPKWAQDHDIQLVASYHDFHSYPGLAKLEETVEEASERGADIAKVAVVVETMSQLFELVCLVKQERGKGRLISAMGMGPLGKLSRLVLAQAGSCLNYGYLQTENAPGQWPAAELRKLIADLAS